MSTYSEIVQKCYLAYYGRQGDIDGIAYWSARLSVEKGNLNNIIDSFAKSTEANSLYGGLDNSQKISKIYQQLFQREPDKGGHDFYLDQLNTGKMSLSSIMLNVADGASGNDLVNINSNIKNGLASLDAQKLTQLHDLHLSRLTAESLPKQTIDLTTFNHNAIVDASAGSFNFVLDMKKVPMGSAVGTIKGFGADDTLSILAASKAYALGSSHSPNVDVSVFGYSTNLVKITLAGVNPDMSSIIGTTDFNALPVGNMSIDYTP